MTDQTKKIDIISKYYSEVMDALGGLGIGIHRMNNIEQILTKLVDEAYEAGQYTGIERVINTQV